MYRSIGELRVQSMSALQRRADDAAMLIGQQLDSVFAALRATAQSDGVRRGDLATAYETATRVAEVDPRIVGISIVDGEGRQVFNTRRPLGTPLPRPPALLMELQRPVIEQGRQVVSPLVIGETTKDKVLGVGLPVAIGGQTYALRAVVSLEALGGWLNAQAWPADWTAAVIDQNSVIVARSRDAERFVGQRATDVLVDAVKHGDTLFQSVTKDGTPVYTSVAPVPGSGWYVVVGQPAAAIHAQVRDSMARVLIVGVLCAMLAVAGALYMARRLARQLRSAVEAHVRGGKAVSELTIREVAELSDALARASEAEAKAMGELQHAREQALAQLKERSDMLDVLAHEVRQPLNNASAALQAASVELLRDGKLTAAEPLRRAELVLNEVQQSIGNTLAVASLLVGSQRIEGVDTDIDALIEVAIADLPPSEAHRVRIERDTNTRTAWMEPGLMRLALRNLLSNALRCSAAGSEVIVCISDSDEPLALILDVIDRGPGIDPGRLATLAAGMPPRAERDARGRRRGLGLQIVHRVMELHGGSLRIERTGPEGTTMRLIITQSAGA
ncbi:sensor histidine kinase [Variovorax sp. YR752]|uniref:sensor histidine kinase n=1 Tax=Variovorax sp. YR752 TaxID=1884383 RepID=UPI003137B2B0